MQQLELCLDAEDLDGSNSYVIHFPADAPPDTVVDSYWSIILVGVPDFRVVDNPLKRYNINTYTGLQPEADGSLKSGSDLTQSLASPSPTGCPPKPGSGSPLPSASTSRNRTCCRPIAVGPRRR